MKQLKCGAAERIITPALGLGIPGYFGPRYATGVKDELYTQAVVVDDGENAVAVVSIDIMDFKVSLTAALRNEIKKLLGDRVTVMTAATHSHTASPTNYECLKTKPHMPSIRNIIKKSAEAIVEAYNNRVPVKAGFAEGNEDRISFCRNYFMSDGTIRTNPGRCKNPYVERPVSKIDHAVSILRFDDEAGNTVARIVNFACHPDTVGGNEYCADYIGQLRRRLKEKNGEKTVLAFLNGCSGDINHLDGMGMQKDPDLGYGAEHYKYMGDCLAETLFNAESIMKFDITPCVKTSSRTFRGERRQPSNEDIEWAENILGSEKSSFSDTIYAEELIELKEHPRKFTNVEIQTISIGECSLSGLPGEIFSEIGFSIKDRSPYSKNMVVGLANGAHGYIVTEPCFSAGVYEARLAIHNSFFAPEIAHKMADVAVELLNEMKK
ncbi:MAG: hypothetical protein E7665_01405 [Ruminococcaceae bacterium]|nr:hypothetical protein [Oscillospiraceae bacterium]